MIETILSIKICLAVVFLIGLITGYQYIKALIKEDFSSILKKFNLGIKENLGEIDDKIAKISSLNHDISKMRTNIKTQKDSVAIAENSLRDIEHVYFKLSNTNNKLNSEIDNTQKILQSHKKEISYYQALLNKNLENDINKQNQSLEDIINSANLNINQNLVKMQSLKDEKTTIEKSLSTITKKLEEKDSKLLGLRNKISNKTIELINKNKMFGLELEIEDLKGKLKSYKAELLSLKSK